MKPEKANEISVNERNANFGLKKNRQPTEETSNGSLTGGRPRKNKEETEMKKFFAKMEKEEGQGLVEYALIIVLVSIAAIITLTALGVKVSGVFSTITASL